MEKKEKLTKKQALARVLLATVIVVICAVLGISEVKKCFYRMDRNDEVINQVRTDYQKYKKEKAKPENASVDRLEDEEENTINTTEE